MTRQKNLAVCSVRELARTMARSIDDRNPKRSKFAECDFAVIDDYDGMDLEKFKTGVTGWYGTKRIDAGFDSNCLILVTDYYGGESFSSLEVWEDMKYLCNLNREMEKMLLKSLDKEEVKPTTLLFVEFLEGK